MRPRGRPSSECGAGASVPAPDIHDGGEPVCYLPLVDDEGTLVEPRHLIHEFHPGAGRVVDLTPGARFVRHPAPELVPRPGEPAGEYSRRLQQPIERTAAWKLVLAAPLAVRLDGDEFDAHRDLLLAYLRDLLA